MAKDSGAIGIIQVPQEPYSNTNTFIEVLLETLQQGITASNANTVYCCPSCTNESGEQVYFLADLPMALQLITAMGFAQGDSLSCCMNLVAEVNSPNYAALVAKDYTYAQCDNNFIDCYNTLSAMLGKDCCATLKGNGVVEYNTLTGANTGSQVCLVLEYLLSVKPSLSASELCEAFSKILEYGIVIRCKDGRTIVTDGCTYMNDVLPCTCWEAVVDDDKLVDITYDCPCPNAAVTVPVFGNGSTVYFCGRNVTSSSAPRDVVITNLGTPCGDCDLYIPCYCYSLTYDDSNLVDTNYIDCNGDAQVLVPETAGTYKLCSRTTPVPTIISGTPIVITQLGLCNEFLDCSETP